MNNEKYNRQERLNRLNTPSINFNHPYYIHYKTYHEVLFKDLEKYAKGRLLDIGCGNKPYKEIVSAQIDEYLGCDIIQSSQNCVDIICPANNIPLANNSIDTVISTQTIEHVENPQELVNEAFRILKKNGTFIVSGPMYWPLHEEPYDFFRFTKYGFRYLLEKAGFIIIEENANGGKWATLGQAFVLNINEDISSNQGFKWKLMKILFRVIGGVGSINKIFLKMDKKYYDETSTLNYVFVAKKK